MIDKSNLPKGAKIWYFTFLGSDPVYKDCVQPIIAGNYMDARYAMFEKYGDHWGFQYSEEQWDDWCNRRPVYFPVEQELEIINVVKEESESAKS